MGTLKEQGFRFMVSNDRKQHDWVHPAEVGNFPDRTDCTDMSDAEFDAFMGVQS